MPSRAKPEGTDSSPASRSLPQFRFTSRPEPFCLWLLASLALAPQLHGDVVINEFCANNGGLLRDEDLQSPYWLEIHNRGPGTVNLGGRHLTKWTPGTNNGAGYLGLVGDTKFSVDRGVYNTPFTVGITSATATASIFWTTNGSVPSPTNGTLYTGPVLIPGTRLLRAAAFLTNHVPSVPDVSTTICGGTSPVTTASCRRLSFSMETAAALGSGGTWPERCRR
jgi:hypothetical protein